MNENKDILNIEWLTEKTQEAIQLATDHLQMVREHDINLKSVTVLQSAMLGLLTTIAGNTLVIATLMLEAMDTSSAKGR